MIKEKQVKKNGSSNWAEPILKLAYDFIVVKDKSCTKYGTGL